MHLLNKIDETTEGSVKDKMDLEEIEEDFEEDGESWSEDSSLGESGQTIQTPSTSQESIFNKDDFRELEQRNGVSTTYTHYQLDDISHLPLPPPELLEPITNEDEHDKASSEKSL